MSEACNQTVNACAENLPTNHVLVKEKVLSTKNQIILNSTLFDDGFDDAILGLNTDGFSRVVYSKKKMIEILATELAKNPDTDDPEYDPELEAIQCLEYNTYTAYMGEGTPLYNDDDIDEEAIDDCTLIAVHSFMPMTKEQIINYLNTGNYEQN